MESPPAIRHYDDYISLGDNCEAGLNFYRIGYNYSSLFRFAVLPCASLLALLENDFEGLYREIRPLSEDMVECVKYRIAYHSRLRSEMREGRRCYLETVDVAKVHGYEMGKIAYLIQKMKADCLSKKDILYITKQKTDISQTAIFEIEAHLLRLSRGNPFTLILLSDRHPEPVQLSSHTHLEPVSYFSPYETMTHKSYDRDSWNRLFLKYPLRPDRKTINKVSLYL